VPEFILEQLSIHVEDKSHTCASLAVSAGANVKALQRMLGHSSARETLDTYSDLFDEDLDAVASAGRSTSRLLRGPRPAPSRPARSPMRSSSTRSATRHGPQSRSTGECVTC